MSGCAVTNTIWDHCQFAVITVLMLLAFCLTGCGNGGADNKDADNKDTQQGAVTNLDSSNWSDMCSLLGKLILSRRGVCVVSGK